MAESSRADELAQTRPTVKPLPETASSVDPHIVGLPSSGGGNSAALDLNLPLRKLNATP